MLDRFQVEIVACIAKENLEGKVLNLTACLLVLYKFHPNDIVNIISSLLAKCKKNNLFLHFLCHNKWQHQGDCLILKENKNKLVQIWLMLGWDCKGK